MDIALEPLKEVIKRIDVLTINDEEARQLSGEHSLVKAAQKILEMGPSNVGHQEGRARGFVVQQRRSVLRSGVAVGRGVGPHGSRRHIRGGFRGLFGPHQ